MSPFHLVQASLIIAKVRARNIIGWSDFSITTDEANAALVEVVPHKPLTSPSRDYLLSSDSLL
jgi:hypothetical protein